MTPPASANAGTWASAVILPAKGQRGQQWQRHGFKCNLGEGGTRPWLIASLSIYMWLCLAVAALVGGGAFGHAHEKPWVISLAEWTGTASIFVFLMHLSNIVN
jgi:hypothetical protein